MSRGIKLTLGILISGASVWWAMHEVNLGEVIAALRQADWRGFIALMLLTLAGFLLRAFRWRWLIGTPKPLPLDTLYSATMIGFMANNLFPFRLGEFVRAWALGRKANLSKTTVFATVVVERVIDMITLLGIFGIALLIHPIATTTEAGRLVSAGAAILVTLCVGLIVVLVVLERTPKLMGGLLDTLGAKLPGRLGRKGVAAIRHFAEGLTLFRDVPRLLWVFFLSFTMFLTFALCLTVSMWALHLSVPWYAGLIMLVITAIGIMVPAAPGYIGTLNLACVAGLALFGVGKEQAVPFSWFFWAGQWIPVTLVGMYYLHREGISLAALTRAAEGGASEPAPAGRSAK